MNNNMDKEYLNVFISGFSDESFTNA